MNPLQDLPLGFGMALAQNPEAAQYFYSLSPERRQEILEKTHQVSSKEEMRRYVAQLPVRGMQG